MANLERKQAEKFKNKQIPKIIVLRKLCYNTNWIHK